MSRQTVLDLLKKLLPAQFEEVVFQFGMPPRLLRREVTLAQQILDLIQYAEQQEKGLDKLLRVLEPVNPPSSEPNLPGLLDLSGLTPPPGDFQYDIFLSHTSADKPRVRRLAEKLKATGLRVWFDEWIIKPGDSIPIAIERGLETSRALALCMSPALNGQNRIKSGD